MERAAQHEGSGREAEATLYVVATPIGNLQDVTLRALDTLRAVAIVAAEDTRVSARLLAHYQIAPRRMVPLHEHNESRATPEIIAALESGRSVALVSDAGTPAFSDPGARLVRAVRDAGHRVVPIPGPNAAAAAFSASGFTTNDFLFAGFLPAKAGERRSALQALATERHTLVLYEAPHRILETVTDLADILGGARRVVLARELTKLFETIHSCALSEASHWLQADPNHVKGEFVLIIEGAARDIDEELTAATRVLGILLEELPVRQAAALAARITGGRKNELYTLALELKKRGT